MNTFTNKRSQMCSVLWCYIRKMWTKVLGHLTGTYMTLHYIDLNMESVLIITAYTLLGRFSAILWSVSVEICAIHSAELIWGQAWLTISIPVHPKGVSYSYSWSWKSSRDEISLSVLSHRWHPAVHFVSQMFVNGVCTARRLTFYTSVNESEWNIWI